MRGKHRPASGGTTALGEIEIPVSLPPQSRAAVRLLLTAEERECQLRLLVRLRENRSTSLLKNIESREIRSFFRHVDVANLTFSGRKVFARH